jgi:cytochrome c556
VAAAIFITDKLETAFMNRSLLATGLALGLLTSLPAAAQFQKPEDAIKYRQSVMTLMGNHVARLGAMVQGRVPFDAKVAAENADVVAVLARLPNGGFIQGSDKGAPTRAKAEIWAEAPKFKEHADKLIEVTGKLDVAAKSGNLDQIRAAFGPVGQTCKACHDAYRADR